VRHLEEPEMKLRLPWYLLAGLFYLAEANVVHLHFRREAHSISFSEIPMVLGLFFVRPQMIVLAVLVGSAAALLIHRRQRPLKLAFNLATFGMNATVVTAVFGMTTCASPS